eukprot:2079058-Amphidinium_carterae.1
MNTGFVIPSWFLKPQMSSGCANANQARSRRKSVTKQTTIITNNYPKVEMVFSQSSKDKLAPAQNKGKQTYEPKPTMAVSPDTVGNDVSSDGIAIEARLSCLQSYSVAAVETYQKMDGPRHPGQNVISPTLA